MIDSTAREIRPRAERHVARARQYRRRPPADGILTHMDVLASRILLRPRDFERSRQFYADTLGLGIFREWGDERAGGVVFYIGAGLLELSGAGTEPPSSAVRLILQVRDVYDEWRRLVAMEVPIDSEPEVKPWGLVEATIRDPDGLAIIVVEVPPGHPQRGPR